MNRKEEILNAGQQYLNSMDDFQSYHTYPREAFIDGAKWSDEHPNPEMVNKQKFIEQAKEWLRNNMRVKTTSYADLWDDSEIDQVVSDFYTIEEMIDSFCKTMEE